MCLLVHALDSSSCSWNIYNVYNYHDFYPVRGQVIGRVVIVVSTKIAKS